jgi:ribosomal protein S18 acetylase RimI-like enzyme
MRPRLTHLRDGTTVLLRLQTPADRHHLAALFAGLTPRSRYLRFCTGTPATLPARYLDHLAAVDGEHHVAVLALVRGRVIAAARFVRDRDEPASADVAITVTDAYQRRGLGRALLETLGAEAAARGITRFTYEILPENHAALALARSYSSSVTWAPQATAVPASSAWCMAM